MLKEQEGVKGKMVLKKGDEDGKMKELVLENGYVVDQEEGVNVGKGYGMRMKLGICGERVKMEEGRFVEDWGEKK